MKCFFLYNFCDTGVKLSIEDTSSSYRCVRSSGGVSYLAVHAGHSPCPRLQYSVSKLWPTRGVYLTSLLSQREGSGIDLHQKEDLAIVKSTNVICVITYHSLIFTEWGTTSSSISSHLSTILLDSSRKLSSFYCELLRWCNSRKVCAHMHWFVRGCIYCNTTKYNLLMKQLWRQSKVPPLHPNPEFSLSKIHSVLFVITSLKLIKSKQP